MENVVLQDSADNSNTPFTDTVSASLPQLHYHYYTSTLPMPLPMLYCHCYYQTATATSKTTVTTTAMVTTALLISLLMKLQLLSYIIMPCYPHTLIVPTVTAMLSTGGVGRLLNIVT